MLSPRPGWLAADRHLAFSTAGAQVQGYSPCAQGTYFCGNCHVSRKIKVMNDAIIFKQDNYLVKEHFLRERT